MADLSPAGRAGGARSAGAGAGGRSGRDRAQLILVGAFALAVIFVALALVMNAAIYTENLATRSESAGTADAHAFERATTTAAERAFRYAHEVNASDSSGHAALERNVTQAMHAYHNVTRTQQAAGGQLVDVTVASTPAGANITETDTVFESPDGGNPDWTVASDVTGTRSFRLDVEDWNGGPDDELWVVAGDANDWYLNVSNDGGQWEVGVNESATYTACTTTGASDVEIDFSEGTVNGDECAALTLGDVGGPYDLKIRNGSVADGDYTVVVDGNPGSALTTTEYDEVLYAMTVDLTYRTPELQYRTTIRVAPGETDG
ncbi:DUF7261 family protein [Halosimplex halophilum]|uniref:DUF7261 family protein n=1 Tax=Halosimplex halophilum TaxID=2559572 RepID=UPI00107F4157|nr:hypothetical protein [Halosimplex halophilum]